MQMERRLTLVRQMLAGGLTHGDIARFASRTWGVGRVQAWRYIRRAYGEPEKLEEEESRMQGALAVRARNAEFRRALREGKRNHKGTETRRKGKAKVKRQKAKRGPGAEGGNRG